MMHLGLMLRGERGDLLHVDAVVVLADGVAHRLEPAAGQVHGRAMRQMAAGGEIETHEGVARLQQREEHGLVGLRAGIGLHIGEAAAKQLFRPLDGEILGDVDILAAAVIALARIAFGIFVGENRALGLQHGARNNVLGGDQLDFVTLPPEFEFNRLGEIGVGAGERGGEETGLAHYLPLDQGGGNGKGRRRRDAQA